MLNNHSWSCFLDGCKQARKASRWQPLLLLKHIYTTIHTHTHIYFMYSTLCLGFLWCWIFHWTWIVCVFLSCQFKMDTGLCGFCGQVSDLGRGWCVVVLLEPRLLRVKGLPFGPRESWHARPGLVSDRPLAGSISESMGVSVAALVWH